MGFGVWFSARRPERSLVRIVDGSRRDAGAARLKGVLFGVALPVGMLGPGRISLGFLGL